MSNSIPRITPPVYSLAAIIVMVLLNSFTPFGHWLQYPWRYLGIIFIVLGLILSVRSKTLFQRSDTPVHPGVKATVLVTRGAFRYTRNPMYLGIVVILIGVAVL